MAEDKNERESDDFASEEDKLERTEENDSDFSTEPAEYGDSDFNIGSAEHSNTDFSTDFSTEPAEYGDSDYFSTEPAGIPQRSKNKTLIVAMIAFGIVASGFFSYYFVNQAEIDSKIIQNTLRVDADEVLASKYSIGEYGSAHAHAALAVFANEEKINFGSPRFQVASKYIHFEDHNPYQIHMHAANVPLDMLFASIGMKVTPECIILNYNSNNQTPSELCSDEQSLAVYVNGEKYYSDISEYVIKHNDRILISYGDTEHLSSQLNYLESLKIYDVPKKTPKYSDSQIFV